MEDAKMKISEMKVDLIDHMGTDLSVVNAARVSFDKTSKWDHGNIATWDETKEKYPGIEMVLKSSDEKLIRYLANHGHWSPFGHATAQFRIKAPIFVARQLVKHQVGLCWNEVSRRYVDSEPEFWFPKEWRGKPKNAKQGSSDEVIELDGQFGSHTSDSPTQIVDGCLGSYKHLLDLGVAPEQARMILPQNMMTEWYWTGSLYAFSRICNQRMKNNAQAETTEVAVGIHSHMKELFPVSWKHLIA